MEFGWTDTQQVGYEECVSFAREQLNDNLGQRDQLGEFHEEFWGKCCDFGVTGWRIPSKYGGTAVDVVSTVRMLEGIGYGCRDNALTLELNGQIWTVQEPLLQFGSKQQKLPYLPPLCSGQLLAADAITEPQSGSDVFSLKNRAARAEGGYLLNGQKCYTGLAPIAGISLVYTSTNPSAKQWGVSAFIVESGFDGYVASQPREKMGLRTSFVGAMVKLHLGEAIADNSLDAMRIHGARDYLKEHEVEREVRDALGGLIYGGTSDIQRNIIAGLLGH